MSIIEPIDPSLFDHFTPESSVNRFRELLYCEARHARLRPDAITISTNLYISDGGIDAQIDITSALPADTFLKPGRNGFQLKTGSSFKPWQQGSLRSELLTNNGALSSEVKRTLEEGGHYTLICFGLDLTPEQRNDSHCLLVDLFAELGFPNTSERVNILGQCQIAPYFDRYPSLRLSLIGGSDEDFFTVAEWSLHAHMSNLVILSEDQANLIDLLRNKLLGEVKHIRLLGEPGIGKTRLVLETVRTEEFAPTVLYVQHSARFSQTRLFRQLLREPPQYPLILILDELSEREMSEIWGHLKNRCGTLKLISLDHGPERSRDVEIETFSAPRLPDSTIKQILQNHVGENNDLHRWIAICEGSPRVAQAVGENLAANPDDILKSPATIPIWDRFLFGYTQQEGAEAQQVALVMRHIALFSRFGFETPVESEAQYIAQLVAHSDPSITWIRFQELLQRLRERRILQGDRTLFIVPWALHIHLWREYWHWNGRGFDFASAFSEMPNSLHGWFMNMFRFAHGTGASPVVRDILRQDGVYADRSFLCSQKGADFLSTLAEADSEATLALVERTFGTWSKEELHAFKDGRQNIVWALEKIAVWKPTFVRAARMLAKLAITENATNSNNATGTLLGLFAIGPEWVATEASPTERLPIVREMLRSADDDWKRMGIKSAESALDTSGRRFRMIGPEYQGIKERAALWHPQTYADWGAEYRKFWDLLINETRGWPDALRKEANSIIIAAAGNQMRVPDHLESALVTLEQIAADHVTDINRLNSFFIQRARWHRENDDLTVRFRLRRLEGQLTRKSLESRFQRYVLNSLWDEWEDFRLESELREHTRPKKLVRALANRIAVNDDAFVEILPKLMSSNSQTSALFEFGRALCAADVDSKRLIPLLEFKGDSTNSQCLGGYLAELKERTSDKWQQILLGLLENEGTANQGAELAWRTGFNNRILNACMQAFEMGWITTAYFRSLCFGMNWQSVSHESLCRLLNLLSNRDDSVSAYVLVDLLDQIVGKDIWIVDADFVFNAVAAPSHFAEKQDTMHSYHWHGVCEKLVAHDSSKAMPLLDVLLQQMCNNYHLSYDQDVGPLAHSLCQIDPAVAWNIIATHLLGASPYWRNDLIDWLKGGMGEFDNKESVPPIAEFPPQMILDWIAQEPERRASIIAHGSPRSLDDRYGGALVRALLASYTAVDGVISGISCNFHSGGWSGSRSKYLRGKRDKFRAWLSQGFDASVASWIEGEIIQMDREIEQAEIAEEREPWNRP